MNIPSPTQITITMLPENEEHGLYLVVDEALAQAGIVVLLKEEKHTTYGSTVSQHSYTEKCITLVLATAATPTVIKDIADLVVTGLILGFTVRGEIDLGERTINNMQSMLEPDEERKLEVHYPLQELQ